MIELTSPNFQILSQDLIELSCAHDMPVDIPLFVLGTTYDKVVPTNLIYDNFAMSENAFIEFYQTGGHDLGYHHSTFVAKKILDFVHDII